VRWVDVNKGDEVNENLRSRLVAKEIRFDKRDDLFAATPPLECKKVLFSLAVTEGIGFEKNMREAGMKLDFIDVRRACFHSNARREVYVALPPEDTSPGMCGLLNKAMYGTCDAAQNWEYEYVGFLSHVGFQRCRACPCEFYHPDRQLRLVVHGDDFTVLGHGVNLDWFRTQMCAKFEVKIQGRLGPGPQDDKSIRILNRILE